MAKKFQLGYKEIEERLQILKTESVVAEEVGYRLLFAFGKSEKEISRYKEGKSVLKTFDGLLIKGLFCYRSTETNRLTETLEVLKTDMQVLKAAPKIVAVSDGYTLLSYDLREKETYENPLSRLYCDFAFFYPLMDVERTRYVEESPADVKAAEKLARLHDELRAYNEFRSEDDLHDLNIFITRLLFCFFAEDTGIFEESLFTSSIARYTKPDGSDLSDYLNEAFNVMDAEHRSEDTAHIITQFPYVNGGLFSKHIAIPRMGAKARQLILECGEKLDWKDINPDIFGSMIQAVVNPVERANQGMHYTSVPNIMKVIEPLFLDELREEYKQLKEAYDTQKRLLDMNGQTSKQFKQNCSPIIKKGNDLLSRINRMKFFDPACGSGNFLIITYKSLRLLEMDIFRLQQLCDFSQASFGAKAVSVVKLSQFYGIELLDFPHEVAMLSLWLAEHQMNKKLHKEFGINTNALPLQNITQIVCGNACRLDWNLVCPHTKAEEVFVFGNPPYLGSKLQSKEQKNDINFTFGALKNSKILDYISIWFYLGSKFIDKCNAKFAFVSTNSICQGEQVSVLWPQILGSLQEITFAHNSFKWTNNAKNNAGVTVVVIGVGNESNMPKALYNGEKKIVTNNINPYLSTGSKTIVSKQTQTPKGLPKICFGCMPYDNGFLLLDSYEYNKFTEEYPDDLHFVRRIYGSEEFINDGKRYCLWIDDNQLDKALKNPEISKRIEKTKEYRLKSVDESGRKLALKAHQFREHPLLNQEKVIIPAVSSENRDYIPMGILDKNTIVSNSAFAIYDAPIWLFGLLTSRMHMSWVRTVSGRLKTDYRYSAQLCYNTFPFPTLSESKKKEIEAAAEEVLITREYYPGSTLADLYDPDKMPQDLREAHSKLDDIVENCYPGYPFASEESRLECLFKLYEKMTTKKQKE